jgi:hypothetical protein
MHATCDALMIRDVQPVDMTSCISLMYQYINEMSIYQADIDMMFVPSHPGRHPPSHFYAQSK